MRAVLCREYSDPFRLELGDIPAPALPGPRAVRVAMRAAGLNFADTLMVAGKYQEKPPLPFVPGLEGAGVVLEVGAEVTNLKPGDRVMAGFDAGAFAEEAVVDGANVTKIPNAMDFETAAAFQVVYGTSHIGLKRRANLRAGETLLVHGAAGGVGLTAVELGKKMGATVIATASGEEKCALARAYGADHAIDYAREDFREAVRGLTGGKGVDVVYDPVGGDVFDASLRVLGWEGRLLVVGFASGRIPQAPANILLVKNLSVVGFFWGAYRKRNPAVIRESFTELLDWHAQGALKPHISLRVPLAEAPRAFAALIERRSTGKVVLTIS
ncbi:MAG: NADPH:quinone oxidoreductase family protein [Alphaproteobacteria bacterium]